MNSDTNEIPPDGGSADAPRDGGSADAPSIADVAAASPASPVGSPPASPAHEPLVADGEGDGVVTDDETDANDEPDNQNVVRLSPLALAAIAALVPYTMRAGGAVQAYADASRKDLNLERCFYCRRIKEFSNCFCAYRQYP